MSTTLYEYDETEIRELLIGRKIIRVQENVVDDEGHVTLDDGTILALNGNKGGCVCSAGDYYLSTLNRVENVITNVEIDTADDQNNDDGYSDTVYSIYVYTAGDREVFAEFTGDDGNGCYGTGFSIQVSLPPKDHA